MRIIADPCGDHVNKRTCKIDQIGRLSQVQSIRLAIFPIAQTDRLLHSIEYQDKVDRNGRRRAND